jgi:toxin ParE1/3/4
VPVRPLRVRWLRTTLANLEAHAQYIARDNRAAARRVVAAIERSGALVARYPASGRRGRVESTRELVVPGTPYIVPYRVRGHTLQILRVFYAARKWPPTL